MKYNSLVLAAWQTSSVSTVMCCCVWAYPCAPFWAQGSMREVWLAGRPAYGAPESSRHFSRGLTNQDSTQETQAENFIALTIRLWFKSRHCKIGTHSQMRLKVRRGWREGHSQCHAPPDLVPLRSGMPVLPSALSFRPPSSMAAFPIPVPQGPGLWLVIHTKVIMGDKKLMATQSVHGYLNQLTTSNILANSFAIR